MALETILLAVGSDDSGNADRMARAVLDVAEPTGARVILAHVFTEDGFEDVVDRLDYEPDSDVDVDSVAGRTAAVQTIRDELAAAGVDYTVVGAVDEEPGSRIVTLVEELDADRVFVGGHDRSPVGKAVFGSTAQTVLLQSPCPVTLVRRG